MKEYAMDDKKQYVRVHIRWMMDRDLPEVVDTEQKSFDFGWAAEDFLRCKRGPKSIVMVAEYGTKVISFMAYKFDKHKFHILNFAVNPNWRLMGVGSQMVVHLIRKLSAHRRTRIIVHIRETNLDAQLFFKRQKFRATKIRRGFYEDTGEAAFRMEYHLIDLPGEQENQIPIFEEN
jgi:[ribosomal protein S18]-alanine N-acetyltransferase